MIASQYKILSLLSGLSPGPKHLSFQDLSPTPPHIHTHIQVGASQQPAVEVLVGPVLRNDHLTRRNDTDLPIPHRESSGHKSVPRKALRPTEERKKGHSRVSPDLEPRTAVLQGE